MDMEADTEQAELESRVGIIYDPDMGLPHVSPLQAIGARQRPLMTVL